MDAQKILVAIDYSDNSEQALQWGVSLAQQYRAKLLLVHVIPKAVEEVYPQGTSFATLAPLYYGGMAPGCQPFSSQPIIIDLQENARMELERFAYKHLGTLPALQVPVGKPAEEILRVARDEGVGLIVMGTHGRTGLRHLLLGSVAEAVSRCAPCPVFTLRASIATAQRRGSSDASPRQHAHAW
jgi:universal stress protein A